MNPSTAYSQNNCSLCKDEPGEKIKTITVYAAHVNQIISGLPRRINEEEETAEKIVLNTKINSFSLKPVELQIGRRCLRRRWLGILPWAGAVAAAAIGLTILTRPTGTQHFALTLSLFLILLWGALILLYDPDEYIAAQLNRSRHILERHKVYFTRRTYLSLQRKHSRQM